MDYEVDLYLRQRWYDQRLMTGNGSRALDLNDPKLVQMIWKPEVFFANAKTAEFQYVTVPNVLVRLDQGGSILYMLRLKLRFSCMMDLYRYPMDSQICAIELASFSKTTTELNLKWSDISPVKLYDKLKLPQFLITNVSTSLCKETFHIGEYSCLKAEFYLQRALGYHLVQSYLPTILIVVISWVSFWLDEEAIPARITLGVTTLLTISSKGIDVYYRLKLRFSCMMDLYRYPMDSQICAIELASFSKTTTELNLKWSDISPVKLYDKLKLPQFLITNVSTSLCKETFHIGEYSCLKAEFYLQRALGYHLVQSYLPTILIVV
ncbi:unnamed protein product, partial [Oppiella nova]